MIPFAEIADLFLWYENKPAYDHARLLHQSQSEPHKRKLLREAAAKDAEEFILTHPVACQGHKPERLAAEFMRSVYGERPPK